MGLLLLIIFTILLLTLPILLIGIIIQQNIIEKGFKKYSNDYDKCVDIYLNTGLFGIKKR
jgi:hypothetical protein